MRALGWKAEVLIMEKSWPYVKNKASN